MGTAHKRIAIFIDRDGVINYSPPHRFVTRWEQFRFLPRSLRALRMLKIHRQLVIVVSNQSAVGRRLMTRRRLQEITKRMKGIVRDAGGKIDAVNYCLHRPPAGCPCRKPRLGLLKRAARRFRIDLQRSFVVGDDKKDIEMGHAAGCRTVLVLSGKQTRSSARRMVVPADRVAKDLLEAVQWILRQR